MLSEIFNYDRLTVDMPFPSEVHYFDMDGILAFSCIEELIEIANHLTVQDY